MLNFVNFLTKLNDKSGLIKPITEAYLVLIEETTKEIVNNIKNELKIKAETEPLSEIELIQLETLKNLY